jgi:hypothetical protein
MSEQCISFDSVKTENVLQIPQGNRRTNKWQIGDLQMQSTRHLCYKTQ